MSSNALESQGIVLKMNSAAVPATFTAIPEVSDLQFRTGSAAVIQVTDLASTAKEKRMGLPDEGQCTFTINILPANAVHAELALAKSDRQSRSFQMLLTDSPATQFDFDAFVLSVPMSASVDGVITSQITLEITGAVVEV